MNILGISAFYHDSSACILQDGRVVAAVQEERFSRRKHDPSFPEKAIEYCLREAGIEGKDLHAVSFYEKPMIKFDRAMETFMAVAPRGTRAFATGMQAWFSKKNQWQSDFQKKHQFEGPVLYARHHEAHAASAFFVSPFEEAAILTSDGVGEWTTNALGHGAGGRVTLDQELRFPHSLGLLYSGITQFLGFRVNWGEYKVMGLAPYGEPRFVNGILENLIHVKEDGSYRLHMDRFRFLEGESTISETFGEVFGCQVRVHESELKQIHMDIARSMQEVTNLIVMRQANHLHKRTGSKHLCMAGGVSLNSVANGKVMREGPFEKVWIQPAANDAGGSVGAALVAWHHHFAKPHSPMTPDGMSGSLLGPAYEDTVIEEALQEMGITGEKLEKPALLDRAVGALASGKILGWHQGRMEYGPRALGSRSILADPRSVEAQRIVNQRIKFRESFRPFAPAVPTELAQQWFELPQESPYMLTVVPVAGEKRLSLDDEASNKTGLNKLHVARSEVAAVTHVDGSARVQSVDTDRSPLFHRLLTLFGEKTGVPVLLNTSFNLRGEPIVCTPKDTLASFLASGMDALAMGSYWIERPAGVEPTGIAPSPPKAEVVEHHPLSSRLFGVGVMVMSLLVITFVLGWKMTPPVILLASLGGLGLIGSAFFPGRVHQFQQGVETVIRGALQGLALVLLVLVYWIVVTPTGWCKRMCTSDVLCRHISEEEESYWVCVEDNKETEDYERMF